MVRMFLIPNEDAQAMSFRDIVLPTAQTKETKFKPFANLGSKLKKKLIKQPLLDEDQEEEA